VTGLGVSLFPWLGLRNRRDLVPHEHVPVVLRAQPCLTAFVFSLLPHFDFVVQLISCLHMAGKPCRLIRIAAPEEAFQRLLLDLFAPSSLNFGRPG
jgi:hypothetical protein